MLPDRPPSRSNRTKTTRPARTPLATNDAVPRALTQWAAAGGRAPVGGNSALNATIGSLAGVTAGRHHVLPRKRDNRSI
jgi:hypothetical protein